MTYSFPDFEILKIKSVDSTNAYAKQFIEKNKRNNFVIVASEQTKGRGQQGNVWHSEEHKNLTFSLVIDTQFINANEQFQLNKVVSLSVKLFIEKILKTTVTIKWPNDIYINNEKIAGILIENTIMNNKLMFSIIGIGINVNQTTFPHNIPNPVSMCNVTGINYDLDKLLLSFLDSFKCVFSKLGRRENNEINNDYIKSLFRLGLKSKFMYEGHLISATIMDVDEFGRLILTLDNEKKMICNFKEIQFII